MSIIKSIMKELGKQYQVKSGVIQFADRSSYGDCKTETYLPNRKQWITLNDRGSVNECYGFKKGLLLKTKSPKEGPIWGE